MHTRGGYCEGGYSWRVRVHDRGLELGVMVRKEVEAGGAGCVLRAMRHEEACGGRLCYGAVRVRGSFRVSVCSAWSREVAGDIEVVMEVMGKRGVVRGA
ncbi:unnamed protein product [Dovyalis caffra]|uniref:Uncharacterized protein n=1 Tax=Dovyalis caffra TaxID=77055 RepID=A0AAV1QVW6_9ROSI|nr:unnamed protein product [Dovyalis caffra]